MSSPLHRSLINLSRLVSLLTTGTVHPTVQGSLPTPTTPRECCRLTWGLSQAITSDTPEWRIEHLGVDDFRGEIQHRGALFIIQCDGEHLTITRQPLTGDAPEPVDIALIMTLME